MAIFHGTKHDDDLNGTSGDDTFDLFKGGEDTASGGAGNDVFNMGGSLDAGDRIDGGADRDSVMLHGDYSAGLVFQDQTLQNIELIRLGAGFDYNLTMADGNVAAGGKLSINASRLGAGNHLVFDGSAETDGHYVIAGGAGNDTITGGAKADIFHLENGGNDTVHGGGGNDIFDMGAAFTGNDVIDGGTGNDTLILDGDYSGGNLTISDAHVTNIENLDFLTRITSTKTTFITGDIAGGHTLDIDVSLTMASRFFLDLSGATSAAYDITANGVISAVTFGGNFSSADKFHNTDSQGVLQLNGDYSGGLTLSGANLGGLDKVNFNGGFSYSVSVVGKIGQTSANGFINLISNVSAGHSVFLDLTQSTAGSLAVNQIGAGDLTVKFAGNFSSSNRIDGSQGTGATTVELDGDYSAGLNFVVVSGATLNHVATLKLDDGFSYKLALDEGNGGTTLTVDATALTAGHTLTFDASEAGSAVAVTGGAGDDTVKFGSNFAAADTFNGGVGNDTLSLNGDYAGGYTFGAAQLTSVESIVVAAGHTYGLTMNNANVASGATMTIDASALGGSDQLFFTGTAETDGHFAIISGAGADNLEGGALSDTFDLSRADGAFAYGNGGADTFTVPATLLDNFIDGGAGTDTLVLNGNFSAQTTITAGNVENIEALTLLGGTNSYNLVLGGGGVEGTGTFTVDASAAAAVTIDLTNADTRTYAITGSGGADTIKFGASFLASDTIDGGAGNDTLALSGGDDIVLGATTLTSIETLTLTGGSFDIVTNDGNVGAGKTLTVDATALTTAQALTFNGAAEQDGNFVFKFGANFTASDIIAGGVGSDTLSFNGTTTATLSDTAVTGVETLDFLGGNTSYHMTLTGDIAGGHALTLDGSASRFLTLDLTAATSASYAITAATVNTTISFGSNFSSADTIVGGTNTVLQLNGDYSSGVTISGANVTKITGGINLLGNNSYTISVVGDFDSGHINRISATPGAANTDFIDLTQGTATYEVINNGTGLMTVKFAGNFNSNEFIGGGNTTVELHGDYSAGLDFITMFAGTGSHIDTLSNVTTLKLDDGFSYKLAMDEDNNGHAMTVDASALTAGHTLSFDGTNDPSGLTFKFGAGFTTADSITGGAGNDTVALMLTGENHLNFTAATIQNVETLTVGAGGGSAIITMNDGNVAAGATLTVDFSPTDSAGAQDINFDGSAETDGHFDFIAPASSEFFIVTGGALSDSLTMLTQVGPSSTFSGLGGDDTLTATASGSTFTFDGGADTDTLFLTGGGTIPANAIKLTSVENMTLDDNTWNIATGDTAVGAGTTLIVDAIVLTGTHALTFDGSGETDGSFGLKGGVGADTLIGGSQADLFLGGFGADTLTGGGGADTFFYTAAIQSTSTIHDTITDFAAGTDKLDLTTTVNQVYSASGSLDSGANFDSQLAALNAMHIGGATEITVTGGTLAGHIILLVDGDGNAQYNAGSDYVIDMTGHTGTLTTGDFI